MDQNNDLNKISLSVIARHSLKRTLINWFLLLSLLPMIFVGWVSLQQASYNLTTLIEDQLKFTSITKSTFIHNWFNYRVMDIKNQVENQHNLSLLIQLKQGFIDSQQSISDYINSFDWAYHVNNNDDQLKAMQQNYNYITDILLIDHDGNILYSTAKKADLGKNLFNNDFIETNLSAAVKLSLYAGHVTFADIEVYPPKQNQVASFLTAPLINDLGVTLGVLAIKININILFDQIITNNKDTPFLHEYIVGNDGHIRTILSKNTDKLMIKKNHLLQSLTWLKQQDTLNHLLNELPLASLIASSNISYIRDTEQNIMTMKQILYLPGLNWVLTSEIDTRSALSKVNSLQLIILITALITSIIVVIIILLQTKRLTQPLIKLAQSSLLVAQGNFDQRIDITSDNEIGQLAKAFNHMLIIRQNYEEKLQRTLYELSKQKFALDQHAIVAITDIEGTIKFVNKKFFEISGYTSDEILGKNHRILNSGYHPSAFFHDLYRTISQGNVWHQEICNRSKNGHIYWVDTTIVPFIGNDGKPESYIAIRTDITEKKQNELEIKEHKKRLELVLESTGVGIWDWSLDTNEVVVNPRWAEMIGYDLAELEPTTFNTWMTYIHPDDLLLTDQLLKQYWDGQAKSYACEIRMLHKQGHWVWVLTTGKVVEWHNDGQVKRMIGTHIDISAQKKNELMLEQSIKEAESATQAKSEFLANMSHEIRTPMNAIIGFGDLLSRTKLCHKQRTYLHSIDSASYALLGLINDILDFSKIEAGKLDLEYIDFNLQAVLDNLSDLFAYSIVEKNLEFISVIDSNIPLNLIGDPLRLTQIISNLVSNAIKFTETGKVLIKISIIPPIAEHAIEKLPFVQLHFSIEDTGIGIQDQQIADLFKSFTQADSSITRKYGGTGLGLAICKQLVKLMDGDIGVTSVINKGSQFWFTLCFAKQTDKNLPDIRTILIKNTM